jgi:hypothetical protein
MYGLYIGSYTSTGTITNRYGVYVADSGNNYFNGSVGIGTTTPSQKLEISGNLKFTDNADRYIYGPGGGTHSLWVVSNPSNTLNGIKFSTDNGTTTEMFLQDGGNVGIGTTNPIDKLVVNGNVYITGSNAGLYIPERTGRIRMGGSLNYGPISVQHDPVNATDPLSYNRNDFRVSRYQLTRYWTTGSDVGNFGGTGATILFDSTLTSYIPNSWSGSSTYNYYGATGFRIQNVVNGPEPYSSMSYAIGYYGGTYVYGSSSIENAYGIRLANRTFNQGKIGRYYGVYIDYPNNELGSPGTGQGIGTAYGVYQHGPSTSLNYFGGKIGIGTTNPSENLHVVGNLLVTSSTATTIKVIAPDTTNAGVEAYGISQGTGYLFAGQSSAYGGGVFYNGDGNPSFATGEFGSDWVTFYRRSANTNYAVAGYFYNNNNFYFAGNVGIGTTLPSEKLEVNGNIKTTRLTSSYSQNTYCYVNAVPSTTYRLDVGSLSDTYLARFHQRASQNMYIVYENTSTGYKMNTGLTVTGNWAVTKDSLNSPNLCVESSSGYVGINTSNPIQYLHVHNGTAMVKSSTNNDGFLLQQSDGNRNGGIFVNQDKGFYTNNGTGHTVLIRANNDYGTGYPARILFSTQGTDRMVIEYNGKVGIGTTDPTQKGATFTSYGGPNLFSNSSNVSNYYSSSTGYILHRNYAGNGIVYFQFGTTTATDSKADLHFTSMNASSYMMSIIGSSENVGIGTSTPSSRLHIYGGDVYTIGGKTDPRILLGDSTTSGQWGGFRWVSSTDTLNIIHSNYSTTVGAINIDNAGKVGINTSSPNSTLNVIGSFSTDVELFVNGTHSLDSTNCTAFADASAGQVQFSLPTASGISGRIYIIKKTDNSANAVVVAPNGAETIDGTAGNYTIAGGSRGKVIIQSDGSNWYIIGT